MINAVNRISDIETSYEIVWAILRNDPNSAYFEFEHHPAMNVEYTLSLDTHKKYKIPNGRIMDGKWCG